MFVHVERIFILIKKFMSFFILIEVILMISCRMLSLLLVLPEKIYKWSIIIGMKKIFNEFWNHKIMLQLVFELKLDVKFTRMWIFIENRFSYTLFVYNILSELRILVAINKNYLGFILDHIRYSSDQVHRIILQNYLKHKFTQAWAEQV